VDARSACELSVVICTSDRGDVLAGALESLYAQSASSASFEVVVIDNSAGRTAEPLLAKAGSRVQHVIRYVHEPAPGLSLARNAGLHTAAGQIVAFLDDDARAAPQWIEALLRGLSESRAAAVGGPVSLDLQAPPPPWLTGDLRSYLGESDFGPRARFLQWPEYPFGLNFAVKRGVARRIGGFRHDLGRVGQSLLSGEEREFFFRLYNGGETVYYCPDAVVHHLVPPERLRPPFFRRRLFWEGRSQRRVERLPGLRGESGGVPRASLRMLRSLLLSGAASAVGDDPRAFLEECRGRLALGYLWEAASELIHG